MKTNEKVRFGKRYYLNEETGEWIYLCDTMAEEEYRDNIREHWRNFKINATAIGFMAAAVAVYIYKPEVFESMANNPFIFVPLAVIGVICGLFILGIVGITAWLFLKEAIPAFKRDILGMDE